MAGIFSSEPPDISSVDAGTVKAKPSYVNKSLAGVQLDVADRFESMAMDYQAMTGEPIKIDDAFRTEEQQAEGYRKKPHLVAPPGQSNHPKGLALDIDTTQAHELDSLGLLDEFGFHRPMMGHGKSGKYEPWHIEPVPDFEKKAGKIAATVSGNKGAFSDEPPQIGTKGAFSDTPPAIGEPSIVDQVGAIAKNLIQAPGSAEESLSAGTTGDGVRAGVEAVKHIAEAGAKSVGYITSGAPYVEMAHGRQEPIQPEEIAAAEQVGIEFARGAYRDASLGLIQPPDVPGPKSGARMGKILTDNHGNVIEIAHRWEEGVGPTGGKYSIPDKEFTPEQRREAEVANIIRTAGGFFGMALPLSRLTKAGVALADLAVPEAMGSAFNKILGTGLGFAGYGTAAGVGETVGTGRKFNIATMDRIINRSIDDYLLGSFLAMGAEGVAAGLGSLFAPSELTGPPGTEIRKPPSPGAPGGETVNLNPQSIEEGILTYEYLRSTGNITGRAVRSNPYIFAAARLYDRYAGKSAEEILSELRKSKPFEKAEKVKAKAQKEVEASSAPVQPPPPAPEAPTPGGLEIPIEAIQPAPIGITINPTAPIQNAEVIIQTIAPTPQIAKEIQRALTMGYLRLHPEAKSPGEAIRNMTIADLQQMHKQVPSARAAIERLGGHGIDKIQQAVEQQAQAEAIQAQQPPAIEAPAVDLTRPASGPLFTDEQLQTMTHEEFNALPPEQQKKFKEDLKGAMQGAEAQATQAPEKPTVKPKLVRKGKSRGAEQKAGAPTAETAKVHPAPSGEVAPEAPAPSPLPQGVADFMGKFGTARGVGAPDVGLTIKKPRKKPEYDVVKAFEKGDLATIIRSYGGFDSRDLLIKGFEPEEQKNLYLLSTKAKPGIRVQGLDELAAELRANHPEQFGHIESGEDLAREIGSGDIYKRWNPDILAKQEAAYEESIRSTAEAEGLDAASLAQVEADVAREIAAERDAIQSEGSAQEVDTSWDFAPKAADKLTTRLDEFRQEFPDTDLKRAGLVLKTFPDASNAEVASIANDPKRFDQLRRQRLKKMGDAGGDSDQMQALPGMGGLFELPKYSAKPKEIQGEKAPEVASGATGSPLNAPLGNQNYPESPAGRRRQVADIKSLLERNVSPEEYRRFWDGIEHSESLRLDPEIANVVKLAAKFGINSVVPVKGAGFDGVLLQADDGPVMLIDQDTSAGITKIQTVGHEIFHQLVEIGDPDALKLLSIIDPNSPVVKQYQESLDMVNGRQGSVSTHQTINEIAADYYGGILTRTLADGATINLKDAFRSPLRAFSIKTRITAHAKQGVSYMAKRGPPPGIKAVSDAIKGPVSLVFPTTMSKGHLRAAEILGSKLGPMNRRQEASSVALRGPSLAFVKKGVHNPKTPLTENPGMKFASDMSQGRPMTSFPVSQRSPLLRIAEKVQTGFEKRLTLLEKADASLDNVRENYFPGMWTPESIRAFNQAMDEAIWTQNLGLDPNDDVLSANDWLPADREWVKNRTTELLKKNQGSDKSALSYLTKRPFKGKESFRKAKVFDDIMTAVEFGLVPVSPNPIDLVKLKYAEMDRSIMANQAIQDYKTKGLVQFNRVSKKTPEGWVQINDKYGTVYGPYDPDQGFRPIYGHWIATEPVADILNHYLSSSIYNNRYFGGLYKSFMSLGNMLNQAQLGGLSLFHAGFTSFEVQCSALAEVIKDIYGLARGNRSIGQVGRTIGRVPLATIGTAKSGAGLRNAWNFPGIDFPVNVPINQLPKTPEAKIAMIAKAMELSGAGLKMERGLRTGQLDKLVQNWYGGRKALATLRSPFALVELGAKPILDFLVPRQKAGVFAHLAERLLEQNQDKSLNELIPQIRQLWNRTDERLGQVRYDRIFTNNIAKNVIQLITRAPGWTGGTISAFIGAPKDLGKFFYEWVKTGKAPQDIPDRVAYLIALATLVIAANGLMTYALTGEKPKGMDYLAFRTGGKDKYGNPTRWLFPTYAKDIYAYIQDPLHTLLSKTHPIIALLGDQIRNRNYYSEMITDKPFFKSAPDRFMAILKQFEPFWTRGAQKTSEQQGGVLKTLKIAPQKIIAPLVGIMPATRAYTATEAMKMMDGFQELRGRRTTTPQEAALNKDYRDIVDMYRRGDVKGAEKAEKQLVSEKKITRDALDKKLSRSGMDMDSLGNVTVQLPQINMFKGLTFPQAMSVWDVATPEEKKLLAETMENKVYNFSKTEAADDYEKDISRIEQEIDKYTVRAAPAKRQ